MKPLRIPGLLPWVLLAAALKQGCIENPGPDSQLGWARKTARAAEVYDGRERLEFRLFEEREGIRLYVTNSGSGLLDSAEFFLELGESDEFHLHTRFLPSPLMVFHAKVGTMRQGDVADFGIIASPVSGDISDYDFKATILKASEGGADRGHALRGLYAGTFALSDTAGVLSSGPIQALIDADGRFGFLETGNRAGDWRTFTGFYAEGEIGQGDSLRLGHIRPEFFNVGLRQLSGDIRREGDSLISTFLIGKWESETGGPWKAVWLDSISIRLASLTPG